MNLRIALVASCLAGMLAGPAAAAEQVPYSPYTTRDYPTRVLWGDLHLHTEISFDAYSRGARLTPEDAFRFARGEEVRSSTGQPIRLSRPLDFLVVADHGETLGLVQAIVADDPRLTSDPVIRGWRDLYRAGKGPQAYQEIVRAGTSGELPPPMADPEITVPLARNVWQNYLETAERYNDPGEFTALIGYEWSSTPGGHNLHRVVVFRDGADKLRSILPFSFLDSADPEDLWSFLGRYEEKTGGAALAIPHNSNLSNGRMFIPTTFSGEPMSAAYASKRLRWEPVVEVTQIKGDSETHPYLSTDDEFADFGNAGWDQGSLNLIRLKTDDMYQYEYLRSALRIGLALEDELSVNPFQFGMLGSTDSHTALTAADEDSFFGKNAINEPAPDRMMKVTNRNGDVQIKTWQQQSAGYAGVWAKENTRQSIFDALRRREVYATTGPRITLRFFGGWSFVEDDALAPDIAAVGYAGGVPMGGVLPAAASGSAPSFLLAALRDPEGANLDRVQIVKGWLEDDGTTRERVFDVAWGDAGRRSIDADGRLEPVGSTVDIPRATYTNAIGDPELMAYWRDPEFDPARRAFYYVRVLEIPTPRWPAYDAARFGVEIPPEVEAIQQERAYSSPIWYSPTPGE